ncbi:FkbM family methyltransferase [Brevibacillus brevis]|uniref:FkbM family methyltransferase n=1 Tax=Brevibacillus brevis TaxID=1393 RepID=UPI001158504D|nr:FkbM family methyltransferase [Lysinibacillus sp. SDF0063]TQR39132.1 FkbM family methyltransferase [Lysinibacillus sp. SDF0063]
MSRMQQIRDTWRKERRIPFPLTEQETWDFWLLEAPTNDLKKSKIKHIAKTMGIRTLIETGTFKGDMLQAMKHHFDLLVSIELDEALFIAAKERFSGDSHIHILHGDSGEVLSNLMHSVTSPCLFWLDGHYIPRSTEAAKGDLDTPILHELAAILQHSVYNHVILIDDARCFIGPNPLLKDYPTIQELREFVHSLRPDLLFVVGNDIIMIYNPLEGATNSMKKVDFHLPFDNQTFTVYGDDSDQSVLYFMEYYKGYYEDYVIHPLKKIVQPDHVCLDIGANIGAISLALSYLAPQGKVYAFEPSDVNYPYLLRNLAENHITNVEPLQLGIADRNGNIHFNDDPRGGGWSYIPHEPEAVEKSTQFISCVRLDDWVEQNMISRIDLIKIDVEGSEVIVLESAMRTLKQWDPDVIIEFNPESITENFGRHPLVLYTLLEKLFTHLYMFKRDNTVVKVKNYNHLLDEMKPFHADLFCTNKTFLD